MSRTHRALIYGSIAAVLATTAAGAAEFKVGTSVGLSGYISETDTAWRDGLLLAAQKINDEGGINGEKVAIVVDDNHSQPQDAVIGYKKMLTQDKVNVFVSGCVTAGTFAAENFIVRAEVPILACTVPPPLPEQRKWTFELRPPPAPGLDMLLAYLKDKRGITKVGILHDQTPYSNIETDISSKLAKKRGMSVVVESYNQNDADMSVQIGRIHSAGAGAIIKIGLGGTTVTAAKDIRQLGLKTLLLDENDDSATYRLAAKQLGDQFLFGADPTEIYQTLPDGPAKQAIATFMKGWRAKYGDRDAYAAAYSWDGLHIVKKAAETAKSTRGSDIRDAVEKMASFQGVAAVYHFSAASHWGIQTNTYVLSTYKDGKIVPVE
jgi:ABC-type branched-subunit amino acid transport system substrate-binding protein